VGAVQNVLDRMRRAFIADKERGGQLLAKGSTSPTYPDSGYDLLQAYGYDALSDYLRLEHDLISRYVDYEEMDDYPEIASSVDVYADDASQPDTQLQRTVWVSSSDKTLQGVLDDLFHKRLRLDEEIWEIVRSLVKYGNDYEEMLVTDQGVVGLNFLPAPTVRRVEGPRGELYGFVQDFKGRFGYSPQEFQKILAQRTDAIRQAMQPGSARPPGNLLQRVSALEPWEVAHLRLRGKHRRSVYGYSVLEPARWIWKRLMLLEDAAMIYRLQRAPERFAFYVDVGDLPPAEALAFVNKIRQQHKKKRFVNPSTGKLDMKFEPLSQDDDFWVPVRKGVEGTRIEVLGGPSWQHMDDVEYFQTKMFSALKVPKAYLAQDESTARAVLSSEDVRFARSVLRVQREVRNGLRKVSRTHLAALNIDPYAYEYTIHMTVPSAIFELAQLEVRNARADLASRMKEHVSLRWVLENVYQLSDDDIKLIIQERSEDVIRDGKAQAEVEKMSAMAQAAAEQASGGGRGMEGLAPPSSRLRLIERKLDALPAKMRNGISEKELQHGNARAEKRANGKLDRLLRSNDLQAQRLREVGALLRDVAAAAAGR
jgi:Bacteriophage T4-like portal protein (Gp20)